MSVYFAILDDYRYKAGVVSCPSHGSTSVDLPQASRFAMRCALLRPDRVGPVVAVLIMDHARRWAGSAEPVVESVIVCRVTLPCSTSDVFAAADQWLRDRHWLRVAGPWRLKTGGTVRGIHHQARLMAHNRRARGSRPPVCTCAATWVLLGTTCDRWRAAS